jgi:methyl-accepting chemotaxis protein
MRSLFLKIFLWFWATAIITGISLVLTFILQAGDIPSPWHAALTETASVTGRIVVEETERAGVHSASSYIDRLEQETHLRACIFDQAGEPLAGAYCATFQDVAAHVASSKTSYLRVRYGVARVAMPLRGNSGREYIFATELPAGLRAATGGNRGRLALTWAVAILVSGLICYLLTSYLTAPILRLREASQHLAAGEFGSRAAGIMERRRDELGDLVRDFNSMAERMEKLVLNQRQLI